MKLEASVIATLLGFGLASPLVRHEKRDTIVVTEDKEVNADVEVVLERVNGVVVKTKVLPVGAAATPRPVAVTPPSPPKAKAAVAPLPEPLSQAKQLAPASTQSHERFTADTSDLSKDGTFGITYTPFKGTEGSASCKEQDEIMADFQRMMAEGYGHVRLYGVDCKQVTKALNAAATTGQKLVLTVFNIHEAESDTNELISQVAAAGNRWDLVEAISAGNENVSNGEASVQQVIEAVATLRSLLPGAGYQGPIIHIDTPGAFIGNKRLCSSAAGDLIGANIHAYFDGGPARESGDFVLRQVKALEACSEQMNPQALGSRVMVTETGWPSGGDPNRLAVADAARQNTAIQAIKSALQGSRYKTFLFSADKGEWKHNHAGTFHTEKFWSVLGL